MADASVPARGRPLVAWLVILAVAGLIVWRQAQRSGGDVASWLVPMRAQARYLVGVKNLGFPGLPVEKLYEQARDTMERGGYAGRLRFAVVAGELVGPVEARRVLADLEGEWDEALDPAPAEVELAWLLDRLYAGYEKDLYASAGFLLGLLPPSSWASLALSGLAKPLSLPSGGPDLSDDEQARLRRDLGWFGELALAPAGSDEEARDRVLAPAWRTMIALFVFAGLGVVGLVAGTVLMVLVACLAFVGRLEGGLAPTGHGGIYAESFAVYFALYVGLGYLTRLLPDSWGGLWLGGLTMLLTLLAALIWPVARGVPWRQVRADLGLGTGEQPLLELLYGVGTYLTALPVLAVGVLILSLLLKIQQRLGLEGEPSHPAVGVALSRDWWVWVQLVVVAAILAPLVEETMFRGALYRHLREASHGWGPRGASVTVSALGTGFLFAVIHPQGWLGVPVLMGLAVVFALAREWRQTLLPPMVAHGINNGVVTLMLLVAAS